MLLAGLGFIYAWWIVEPSSNCSRAGECANWLHPLSGLMGLLFAAGGLSTLIANTRRGIMIDPANGDLVWWRNRTETNPGIGGRIAPEEIACVQVFRNNESNDLFVYDRAGKRLNFLDDDVVPDLSIVWARKLVARWPHIVLEER